MKKFFAATAAALAIFAACSAEASLLRVGIDADFQPYEYYQAESAAEAVGMLFEGEAGRAVTSKLAAEYLVANVYSERLVIASEDGAAQLTNSFT